MGALSIPVWKSWGTCQSLFGIPTVGIPRAPIFPLLESLGIPRTRYHSLVVDDERWPEILEKTAWTDDGMIMGLKHRDYPCWGVQFHPESLASEHGHRMLANFLRLAGFNGSPIQPIEEIEARLKRSGTHG